MRQFHHLSLLRVLHDEIVFAFPSLLRDSFPQLSSGSFLFFLLFLPFLTDRQKILIFMLLIRPCRSAYFYHASALTFLLVSGLTFWFSRMVSYLGQMSASKMLPFKAFQSIASRLTSLHLQLDVFLPEFCVV
jgi:hypothetical protein